MIWERLGIARWAFYGSIALHLCLALLIIWTESMRSETDRGSTGQWIRARLIPESTAPATAEGRGGKAQETQRPKLPVAPEVRTPEPRPPTQALAEPQTAEDERALRESEERARRQAEEEARRRAEAERRAALERQRQAEAERQRQAEAERQRQAEAERQRQAEAERRRQEAEAQARRQAEERAREEAERRRAEQQARQEAEERARREAERRRQAEERARLQAEAERKRLEEEAERLAAEEAARLEAEEEARRRRIAEESERLAQIEERRLAEEMQRLAEPVTPSQDTAERREVVSSGQQSGGSASEALRESQRYIPLIRERVRQFWARPPASGPGLSAVVRVRLLPGGEVVPGSVQIIKSSGHTAFDQSVVAAIYRASPLPVPSGAAFEPFREFDFTFRP